MFYSYAQVSDELEVIWLQPKEKYAYLREGDLFCAHRKKMPKDSWLRGSNFDGGPKCHMVAYAVLKPDAKSRYPRRFERRYWWVKTWDRWEGHGYDSANSFYERGQPTEAVAIESIKAGAFSKEFRS